MLRLVRPLRYHRCACKIAFRGASGTGVGNVVVDHALFVCEAALVDAACDNGASGAGWTIGTDSSYGNSNYVNKVTVIDGKISVVPTTKDKFVATQTFELSPSAANGAVIWSSGGGCKAAGLC